MSQRLGMADGRCHTINNSSLLYDNYLKTKTVLSMRTTTRSASSCKKRDPNFTRSPLLKMTEARVVSAILPLIFPMLTE